MLQAVDLELIGVQKRGIGSICKLAWMGILCTDRVILTMSKFPSSAVIYDEDRKPARSSLKMIEISARSRLNSCLEVERRDREAVLGMSIGVADSGFSLLQLCLAQLDN